MRFPYFALPSLLWESWPRCLAQSTFQCFLVVQVPIKRLRYTISSTVLIRYLSSGYGIWLASWRLYGDVRCTLSR